MRTASQHEHPTMDTEEDHPAKKICSPNSRPQDKDSLISPNCVIAIADNYPEELILPPPETQPPHLEDPEPRPLRRASKSAEERAGEEEEEVPHLCWWQQLRSLNGPPLMERLKSVCVDEMLDYHGGVLNARFVDLILELYDHVASQGDGAREPDSVYGAASPYDPETELPYWSPKSDSAGFGRMERLRLAAEYDVWQWYLVTGENYSLLDTLVWMGVHVRKLFSRPSSPSQAE